MTADRLRGASRMLRAGRARRIHRTCLGFTLVELLVALSVMGLVAALAWQGVDSMVRTRSAVDARLQAQVRLNTALAQWQHDLQHLHDSGSVPALGFDGQSLRLVREGDEGAQVVVWSARDGRWTRWASPITTRADELQSHWLRSQQLLGREPGHITVLDTLPGWQLFYWRGNSWSNAQSTGDRTGAAGAPGTAGTPGTPSTPPAREALPQGVRLVLQLPQGPLMRDLQLAGGPP
jgi:general secretion pathway protein J